MKYVLKNHYAKPTSRGFSNTYYVLAFENDQDAREYVQACDDLVTCLIKKRDIGKYIDGPKPFSGRAFCITTEAEFARYDDRQYRGRVWNVEVEWPDCAYSRVF